MTTRRALTGTESLFVLAGFGPVVVSTTCSGRIDPDALDEAWQSLADDYPVLRCVIRPDGAGFSLELQDTAPPLTTGATDFPTEATTPLNGAVSRLTLRQDATSAVVTLAVDHALSDARLVQTLLHALLSDAPRTPRPAFDRTLEERLRPHHQPHPPQPPGTAAVLSGGTGSGFGFHHVTFTRETTAEIVALARKNHLTVNDLLCGAVATAIRTRFPATDGPLPIALCIPVDLRPRLDPPIAPDAQICAAIPSVVTVHVDVDDEPADVGRRVGEGLRASIDRDEPQRTALTTGPPPPMTFMVSNVGVVDPPSGVTGSRFAATLCGPVPGVFVATVNDQLTVDVVHDLAFQSEADIGEIVNEIAAYLPNSDLTCV